jgi:hypothetical protein
MAIIVIAGRIMPHGHSSRDDVIRLSRRGKDDRAADLARPA